MADAGVDQYTFHVEPVEDVPLVCRKVKEAGMKVDTTYKNQYLLTLIHLELMDTHILELKIYQFKNRLE